MTKTPSPAEDIGTDGVRRLAAHVEECAECQGTPPAVDRIAAHLNTGAVDLDAAALSARTLARVRIELHSLSQWVWWRRVGVVLVSALLPLPLVIAYDAYVLNAIYAAVSAVLPPTIAEYVVGSYAAFLVLLFALTYAAVPILVPRTERRWAPVTG